MPTKITKATATQNSGSANMARILRLLPLALERVVDRGRNGGCGRGSADQPLDDGRGGIERDAAHVSHRGSLGAGDGLFGFGKLRVQFSLDRLAAGFTLG